MICIRERYFKFNRIILLAVGIWPFQQSKVARLRLVLFLGILMSFTMFQVCRHLSSSSILFLLCAIYELSTERARYSSKRDIYILFVFLLQLSRLLFVDYTFDFTLKMLSVAMFLTFLMIKYLCFSINIKTVSWFFAICESIIYLMLQNKPSICTTIHLPLMATWNIVDITGKMSVGVVSVRLQRATGYERDCYLR